MKFREVIFFLEITAKDFQKRKIINHLELWHQLCLSGRDGVPVRRPHSQPREPGFKSHCGRFEPFASLITPRGHSSLSCINEYLVIQIVVEM